MIIRRLTKDHRSISSVGTAPGPVRRQGALAGELEGHGVLVAERGGYEGISRSNDMKMNEIKINHTTNFADFRGRVGRGNQQSSLCDLFLTLIFNTLKRG